MSKSKNVHVSFAECTDQEDDMAYLDQWDGQIPNFDNTDDYREELARVKAVQGPQFKFDYTDYVVKILLATFVRWYFLLYQQRGPLTPLGARPSPLGPRPSPPIDDRAPRRLTCRTASVHARPARLRTACP